MIGYLQGVVSGDPVDGHALILTTGGVGYVVATPDSLDAGDDVQLHVVTVVREDAINLFGFGDPCDAAIFRRITRVNGVGPQMGLNLIRSLGGPTAVTAIANGDIKLLTTVTGIGPSVAKKIVVNSNFPDEFVKSVAVVDVDAPYSDITDALIELGYDTEMVRDAMTELEEGLSDAEAMKSALSLLRKQQ